MLSLMSKGMHNNNKENNMDATEQLQKQLNGWMQNELGDALSTDLDVDSNGDKQLAKLAQATREKKKKSNFIMQYLQLTMLAMKKQMKKICLLLKRKLIKKLLI